MMTLPSEGASDGDLIEGLVRSGLDIARLHCAHDGPEAWRLIQRLQADG